MSFIQREIFRLEQEINTAQGCDCGSRRLPLLKAARHALLWALDPERLIVPLDYCSLEGRQMSANDISGSVSSS